MGEVSGPLRTTLDRRAAARHRNRVRAQVWAALTREPAHLRGARLIGRLIDYGPALGMPLEAARDIDLGWEIERGA